MTTVFEQHIDRVAAGERLSADEIRSLAETPDILQLGMLADAVRRQRHGSRATFVRVARCAFDQSFSEAVPPAAREICITGAPETLGVAVTAIETARDIAGDRLVSGFSWADVERLAAAGDVVRVLEAFKGAGLDAIAELPLDRIDVAAALRALTRSGFEKLRLSVANAAARDRTELLLRAGELQDEFGCVQALDPLPTVLNTFKPTTGYEDVKMVAIGRLAAASIPTVQVDWQRYGPKLAQVALTFGADDVYGVSSADDVSEGRRRAPIEEIRRNIQAAGFEPHERDGRFNLCT